MNVSILTIFPKLFDNFWNSGIISKAVNARKLSYSVCSVRDFASDCRKTVDDRPFGGGCGMVMKPGPIVSAIKDVKKKRPLSRVVLLSPQGKKLDQSLVQRLSIFEDLIFICGRYEGIDERVSDLYVDFEISIGDFVLTGGELAAMVVLDAMVRLIPGVLGNPDSANRDTFSNGMIGFSQYTRPRKFEGELIPEVLFSGNHKAIDQWRHEASLLRTLVKRKDLLRKKQLTYIEIEILDRWRIDIEDIIQKQFLHSSDTSSCEE